MQREKFSSLVFISFLEFASPILRFANLDFVLKFISAIFSLIFLGIPKTSKADNDSPFTLLSAKAEMFSAETPNFSTLSRKSYAIIPSAVLAPIPFYFLEQRRIFIENRLCDVFKI